MTKLKHSNESLTWCEFQGNSTNICQAPYRHSVPTTTTHRSCTMAQRMIELTLKTRVGSKNWHQVSLSGVVSGG